MAVLTLGTDGQEVYDYSNMAAAVSGASNNDAIQPKGTFASDDESGQITITHSWLDIIAHESARYKPGQTGHYVKKNSQSSGHVFQVNANMIDSEISGFEVVQDTGYSSAEGIRVVTNNTVLIQNMRVRTTTTTGDQDGIYTYHSYGPNLTIRNTEVIGFARVGVHYQIYSNGNTNAFVLDMVNCTVTNCGSDASESAPGGVCAAGSESSFDMDITVRMGSLWLYRGRHWCTPRRFCW